MKAVGALFGPNKYEICVENLVKTYAKCPIFYHLTKIFTNYAISNIDEFCNIHITVYLKINSGFTFCPQICLQNIRYISY